MQSGLLYLDKVAGMTSHDAVTLVRRAARTRRVGHAGTLDPFATGLLVLAVGDATRLLRYINGEPKVYLAEIRFGFATDTDDATGTAGARSALPGKDAILAAITELTGTILQVPPAYSAKHVSGKRAYALARRGEEVQLAPVQVAVHSWSVVSLEADRLVARITCSGGTYIRALARDLGTLAGSAAHCSALRREASGPAHVDMARRCDDLLPGAIADGIVPLVNPLEVLEPMDVVVLNDEQRSALMHGRMFLSTEPSYSNAVLVDSMSNVMGIAEAVEQSGNVMWQPRVVLSNVAQELQS